MNIKVCKSHALNLVIGIVPIHNINLIIQCRLDLLEGIFIIIEKQMILHVIDIFLVTLS